MQLFIGFTLLMGVEASLSIFYLGPAYFWLLWLLSQSLTFETNIQQRSTYGIGLSRLLLLVAPWLLLLCC
uniref:Uncharacterized protein n=1 Tax=Arundo donax TaxID=35708 RepID=A0A0A9G6H3_ARUDO